MAIKLPSWPNVTPVQSPSRPRERQAGDVVHVSALWSFTSEQDWKKRFVDPNSTNFQANLQTEFQYHFPGAKMNRV